MEKNNLTFGNAILVEYGDNTIDSGIFIQFYFVDDVEVMKCFLMYERPPERTETILKEEIRFVDIDCVREVKQLMY